MIKLPEILEEPPNPELQPNLMDLTGGSPDLVEVLQENLVLQ